MTADASAARPRACCATSPSAAPPPTCAPGCCSSTSARGATTRCCDARLPDGLGRGAQAARADPPREGPADPPVQLEAGRRRAAGLRGVRRPGPARGWRPARVADPREVLDLDLGGAPRAAARAGWRRTTARSSASAPTAATTRAAPSAADRSRRRSTGRTPTRPGRSRTSAATGSRPTWSCCRTVSTTGGSTRSSAIAVAGVAPGRRARPRPPARPRRRSRWPVQAAEIHLRRELGATRERRRRPGRAVRRRRPHHGDVRGRRRRRTTSSSAPSSDPATATRLTCKAHRDNPVPARAGQGRSGAVTASARPSQRVGVRDRACAAAEDAP